MRAARWFCAPTQTGFLSLAVVLDVRIRRVVGWAIEAHLRTELVLDAHDMVVGHRRPANVIHHSDQGYQYTSIAFGLLCESFFGTRECELLERRRFRSQIEARLAVFDYIEGFYNSRRRHSALDDCSPIDCERRYAHAA